MIFFVFLILFFQIWLGGFHAAGLNANIVNSDRAKMTLSHFSQSQVALKNQQHIFQVEVARTESELEKGLMHRTSMPQDYGMFFVFPDEQPRAFWMKNTLIPLDMIFADSDGKIVKIWANVPPCTLKGLQVAACPTYSSDKPSRYVLEVNAGIAQKISLQEGDLVFLPKEIL